VSRREEWDVCEDVEGESIWSETFWPSVVAVDEREEAGAGEEMDGKEAQDQKTSDGEEALLESDTDDGISFEADEGADSDEEQQNESDWEKIEHVQEGQQGQN
jgi:hypothetical protein